MRVVMDMVRRLERMPPRFVKTLISSCLWEGDPTSGVLALTFDDGPDPAVTPLVLDMLGNAGVHATFFLTGKSAGRHPDIARRIVSDGHLVGNHTQHHRRLLITRRATVRDEIDAAQVAITEATGVVPRWFRPPYGQFNGAVLDAVRERYLRMALWTALSGDYREKDPSRLIEAVRPVIRPGAILVFHDTLRGGGETLPAVIGEVISLAHDRGVRIGDLDDLVATGSPSPSEDAC